MKWQRTGAEMTIPFDRDRTARWEPMGLSGGGAMFTPAISPADPKRMMVNCDMGAAYITHDGGLHWQMIHYSQLRSNTRCRPAFHPTDPRIVYAANGGAGLSVSHDGGLRWRPIGSLPGSPQGEIAIDPGNPARLLAGAGTRIYYSHNAGRQWMPCDGPEGEPLAFHFDQTSPSARRTWFAATSLGVWRSGDAGKTWTKKTAGLPAGDLLAFAGGSNARRNQIILILLGHQPCRRWQIRRWHLPLRRSRRILALSDGHGAECGDQGLR